MIGLTRISVRTFHDHIVVAATSQRKAVNLRSTTQTHSFGRGLLRCCHYTKAHTAWGRHGSYSAFRLDLLVITSLALRVAHNIVIGVLDLAKSADQFGIDNEFLLTAAVFDRYIVIAQISEDRPDATACL